MISANIPDVDVLVFVTGASPVAFRRGITHGIVAHLLPSDAVHGDLHVGGEAPAAVTVR